MNHATKPYIPIPKTIGQISRFKIYWILQLFCPCPMVVTISNIPCTGWRNKLYTGYGKILQNWQYLSMQPIFAFRASSLLHHPVHIKRALWVSSLELTICSCLRLNELLLAEDGLSGSERATTVTRTRTEWVLVEYSDLSTAGLKR